MPNVDFSEFDTVIMMSFYWQYVYMDTYLKRSAANFCSENLWIYFDYLLWQMAKTHVGKRPRISAADKGKRPATPRLA